MPYASGGACNGTSALKKSSSKLEPTDTHSRRFCSSSGSFVGPVFVSRTTNYPLTAGMKYIDVQLLTGQHLYVAVDVRCKVGDIFDCVCSHIGAQNPRLFGLCIRVENEYRFLQAGQKLAKCTQKNWAKSGGWGTDMHGQPSVILYLRVHTYVDTARMISCPVSLLHYYMQLRENVRLQWEEQLVREERCYEVTALALQADFGDYGNALTDSQAYFCPELYFPAWVVTGRGQQFLRRHTPLVHQDLNGVDGQEARYRFCDNVSSGCCAVNAHLYRLQRHKGTVVGPSTVGDRPGQCPTPWVLLAIAPDGLHFSQPHLDNPRFPIASFPWARIAKLSFDRRKFVVVSVDGQKLALYASSDQKSRYLLQFCRTFHQNLMKLHTEGCTESVAVAYCNDSACADGTIHRPTSDKVNGSCVAYDKNLVAQANSIGQRVSLVSDASSNTTSGIVSDKQRAHGEDSENDNEPDLDLEAGGNGKAPLVHSDSARSEASYASKGASASSREGTPSPVREVRKGSSEVSTIGSESRTTGGNAAKAVHFSQQQQQQQQHPVMCNVLEKLEEKLRTCQLVQTTVRDLPANGAARVSAAADVRLRSLLTNASMADSVPSTQRSVFCQQHRPLVSHLSSAANLEPAYNNVGVRYSLAVPTQLESRFVDVSGNGASSVAAGSPVFARRSQPPNYEQAVLQTAAAERHQGKRWTTITCIEPSVLSQMSVTLDGQLHQAQSEPGLGVGPVGMWVPPSSNVCRNQEVNASACRSVSSYILGSKPASLEECYYTPATYCHSSSNNNNNNNNNVSGSCAYEAVTTCGSRNPFTGDSCSAEHHMVQHNSTMVSRTQSLQEPRYNCRLANGPLCGPLANAQDFRGLNAGPPPLGVCSSLSSSELTQSRHAMVTGHGHSGYCYACQEKHDSVGTLDLDRMTSIIQGQAVDLPLIRALCSEHALQSATKYCSVSDLDRQAKRQAASRLLPLL